MAVARIAHHLDSADRAAVDALLDAAAKITGEPALSDHLRLDLQAGGTRGFVAAFAGEDGLDGYAQVSAANESASVEIVIHPDAAAATEHLSIELLRAVRAAVEGPLYWWVHGITPLDERIAASVGMSPERRLLQLRRPLPTGLDAGVETRPFVPGQDEDAWLSVNNRAFAWHPEQGGWDLGTLQAREAEPWFEPAGFLLHERDGRLAAFCWTKLHPPTPVDPPLGEIYVIAVDPDYTGLGLGKALTLAGLASIADRGVTTGMLFVDESNTTAVALYDRLGFTTHRVDVAFLSERR
jgi:mycothiol synthase